MPETRKAATSKPRTGPCPGLGRGNGMSSWPSSQLFLSLGNSQDLCTSCAFTGPFLHARHSVTTEEYKDEKGTGEDPRKSGQ